MCINQIDLQIAEVLPLRHGFEVRKHFSGKQDSGNP